MSVNALAVAQSLVPESANIEHYRRHMDHLKLVPKVDQIEPEIAIAIQKGLFESPRMDASQARLAAEMLRYTYTTVLEEEYPELSAFNGDILPIDTRVPVGIHDWEYWITDYTTSAHWIGDDGKVMPSSAHTGRRVTGRFANLGHAYIMTLFELERARLGNFNLSTEKVNAARRAIAELTNWTWLFGDADHSLPGFITNPNIQVTLAPLSASGTHGDNRDRLPEAKTDDEVIRDVADTINRAATTTIRRHFTGTVYMPLVDVQHFEQRRVGTENGTLTMMQFLEATFGSARASGPGVSFEILNECDPLYRRDPTLFRTDPTPDSSGVEGRFWMAVPTGINQDEAAFLMQRPFTQRPPQVQDLALKHDTFSSIGGCKITIPQAFHRKDFLATNTSTAAP